MTVMAGHELRLPKLGMQMVDGTLERWLVDDGAHVEEGQELAVVTTDKVDTAIGAPAAGTIAIHIEAGETVEVGTLLATVT
jgi:pyruvate/2-oxoglutarate dehydrogenase complex dihydrolipoamide acyltransferase (E2) component